MKIDPELKQLIQAGASLLTALADRLNHDTERHGGKVTDTPSPEPKPDVEAEGKPEPEATPLSTGEELTSSEEPTSSVTEPQQTDSSPTESGPPPPPPPPNGEAATPPPPPNEEKPAKKITKPRARKLNADMVEVAQNLGDATPVRNLLLEYGVTTPAEFTKEQADAFVVKLKEL